jgi:hypothetical protein
MKMEKRFQALMIFRMYLQTIEDFSNSHRKEENCNKVFLLKKDLRENEPFPTQ